MKLTFDGFEVEIKAKGVYGTRYNKMDAMAVLNMISIMATDSAKVNRMKSWDKIGKEIYNVLLENGCYDNI